MGRKIVVAGCRDFHDFEWFSGKMDAMLQKIDTKDVTLISGGASGVDHMAGMYADMKGCNFLVVDADWSNHGKAAGPIRNKQMAEMADEWLIAFWDGKSRGTMNMIQEGAKAGLRVSIIPLVH